MREKLDRATRRLVVIMASGLVVSVGVLIMLGLWTETSAEQVEQISIAAESVVPSERSVDEPKELVLPSDLVPLPADLQMTLAASCELYGVPAEIALGCIETESGFQASARNGSCYGYMQVNTINLEWLGTEIGVIDLTDPAQNICSGLYILGDLYGRYGDWHKALVCYNCGERGAQRDVFSRGLTSTGYSEKVMARAEQWKEVLCR